MTSKYIAFPKKACQNITNLCWIPQADSIIHKHIINGLPQCDTIEKYLCMLDTIRRDTNKIEQLCTKSCKAEAYKLSTSRNAVDAFTWVRKNIDWILWSLNCSLFFYFKRGKLWTIYVLASYKSFTESLYNQTELYDFNAVIASVGGSLGLFLGFSCYGYGKRLIDSIPVNCYQLRKSSSKMPMNIRLEDI